ncbi:hypothetical protein U8C33_37600 (plasmid) [Sinorhizobium meliloti]|nr:hypothetical protein U8C33_37600 [Sinorhizobium meliloti]
MTKTRVAAVIQRAVIQGCGLPFGSMKPQPTTRPWSVKTATRMRETETRGEAATMLSVPPWGQAAVVPV